LKWNFIEELLQKKKKKEMEDEKPIVSLALEFQSPVLVEEFFFLLLFPSFLKFQFQCSIFFSIFLQ